MPKVLINALSVGTGGGRVYLYNLLKNCAKISDKHEYLLMIPASCAPEFASLTSARVTILSNSYQAPEEGWVRVFWEQAVLPLIALRYRIDVLVSTGSVDVFLASRVANVPSVVIVQTNQPWMVPDLLPSKLRVAYLRWGVRLSSLTAKRFVVMSETAKEELSRVFNIDPARISVVYHGGADASFSPAARSREEVLHRYKITKPYILSVSSIFTFKNYHRLIQAYGILNERISNLPALLIVGAVKHRTYFHELQRLIEALGLERQIRFLGPVAHHDLPPLYANATLYVFPSLCETFGLTQIEAMACGVPVLASNTSVMPEISGDAAMYFDPYNPEDMAETMGRMLMDATLRAELRAKGLERARQFSWEKTARQTLRVLEEVAGK